MKYIKVFTSVHASELQNELDEYCEENKHNIIQQCSSIGYEYNGGYTKKEYLLTVTFDGGEG